MVNPSTRWRYVELSEAHKYSRLNYQMTQCLTTHMQRVPPAPPPRTSRGGPSLVGEQISQFTLYHPPAWWTALPLSPSAPGARVPIPEDTLLMEVYFWLFDCSNRVAASRRWPLMKWPFSLLIGCLVHRGFAPPGIIYYWTSRQQDGASRPRVRSSAFLSPPFFSVFTKRVLLIGSFSYDLFIPRSMKVWASTATTRL